MKNVFIFLGGAAVGSLITWKVLDEKYKKLADEEIESVVETFNKRKEELETKHKNEEEYSTILNNAEYMTHSEESQQETASKESAIETTKNKKSKNKKDQVYVIDIDSFGDNDEYSTKTWIHYADGVLADEFDNVVETPSMFLGEALSSMNEEDESIYVRNDILKCDYEVIKSEKSYDD